MVSSVGEGLQEPWWGYCLGQVPTLTIQIAILCLPRVSPFLPIVDMLTSQVQLGPYQVYSWYICVSILLAEYGQPTRIHGQFGQKTEDHRHEWVVQCRACHVDGEWCTDLASQIQWVKE